MRNRIGLSALFLATASMAAAQDANTNGATSADSPALGNLPEQTELYTGPSLLGFDMFTRGWNGGFSIGGSWTTFSETREDFEDDGQVANLRVALGVHNHIGDWRQNLNILTLYSQRFGDDKDVIEDKDYAIRVGYELIRDFSDRLYGVGSIYANADSGSLMHFDGFGSIGLGYRVLDSDNMAWRVQAGPGYRYAEGWDEYKIEEAGLSVASRAYFKLTDSVAISNDTGYLWSENMTAFSNDLGMNVQLSDKFSTRFGYLTTMEEVEEKGFERTDGQFTVSIGVEF